MHKIKKFFILMHYFTYLPGLYAQINQKNEIEKNRPTLIYIVNSKNKEHSEAYWRNILRTPEILDFDIATKKILTLPSIEPDNFHNSDRIQTRGWAIAKSNGEIISSGSDFPDTGTLVEALDNSGAKRIITPLRRFVRDHPSHIPARLRLMEELVSVSLYITSQIPNDPTKNSHTEGWVHHELGKHLEYILRTTNWSPVAWKLRQILMRVKSGTEGSALKASMEASLPLLREVCHLAPSEAGPLSLYLYINNVLGFEPNLGFLFNTVWFSFPGRPYEMPPEIPKLLVNAARKSGHWIDTLSLLKRFVNESYLPWASRSLIIGDERVKSEQISASRTRGWEAFAEPLIEAMLRCDREMEALEWLGNLDESWSTVKPYEQAHKIAVSMGKGSFASRLRHASQRSYHPSPPGINFDRPVLFHDGTNSEQLFRIANRLQDETGLLIQVRKIDKSWSNFLTWSQCGKKWSMVDLDGREVSFSSYWQTDESLYATIQSSELTAPIIEAKRFNRLHPNHLEGLLFLAESCLNEALAIALGPNSPLILQTNSPRKTHLDYLIKEYVQTTENILDLPLGKSLAIRKLIHSNLPDLCLTPSTGSQIKFLAAKLIPHLEAELLSFPNDLILWENWVSLKSCTNENLDFDFCTFPSHRRLGLGPIPPYGTWHKIIYYCDKNKAWNDLIAFLLPRMEEELVFAQNRSNEASRQNLSAGIQVLTKSMIQSERIDELSIFLSKCLANDIRGLALSDAINQCKKMDYPFVVSLLESLSTTHLP